MSRGIDLLITYRVIKLLVTPFNKMPAFKKGIIDADGNVLIKFKKVQGNDRKHYTILHRFVFNLKRIINFIPGGKSKLGTYAAALGLLLKEGKEINMVELEKDLYKHLSENNLIKLDDDVKESVGFDFLPEGKFIITDKLEDLNGKTTADIGDVVYTTEDQKPFDNYFGVNLYNVINVDTKKQIIVSEDNIERIRL